MIRTISLLYRLVINIIFYYILIIASHVRYVVKYFVSLTLFVNFG